MLNKVKLYIEKHSLLDKSKLYIVALSGGADSVCLLSIMRELGYKVEAAHCNFKLRGEESDRDETFCRKLCEQWNVPFHFTHFDTQDYADSLKISIEMAARNLRYVYFRQLKAALGADAIVVAHHRDDNVETLLLNLLRGTGIKGLTGMQPRNNDIVRPLLCVSRHEVELYLKSNNIVYVTDSSNLIDDVKRNKIRLNVIPLLKEITPAAPENIARTIENLAEAAKMLEAAETKSLEECVRECEGITSVDIDKLNMQSSPEHVLHVLLKKYGFSSQQSIDIYENLKAQVGKKWYSGEYTLVKERDHLLIGKSLEQKDNVRMVIPEDGNYRCTETANIKVERKPKDDDFIVSREKWCATLDAEKVKFPLTVRNIKEGDRFRPYGMKGTKLISDYLTDKRVNYFKKKNMLVTLDATGKIIWLIGERTSQEAACTNDTINILTMRYVKDEE